MTKQGFLMSSVFNLTSCWYLFVNLLSASIYYFTMQENTKKNNSQLIRTLIKVKKVECIFFQLLSTVLLVT